MQNNLAANNKRREKDVMKLMTSGKFDITLINEHSTQEFDVLFNGPKESPYEGVSIKNRFLTFIFLSGNMESSSHVARYVSVQIAKHWIQKPHFSSKYRRRVSFHFFLDFCLFYFCKDLAQFAWT